MDYRLFNVHSLRDLSYACVYIYTHTGVGLNDSESAQHSKTPLFVLALLTGFELRILMSKNLESEADVTNLARMFQTEKKKNDFAVSFTSYLLPTYDLFVYLLKAYSPVNPHRVTSGAFQ